MNEWIDGVDGTCGACGTHAHLWLETSPLQAPATVALCPECHYARTLPLYFVAARVEFASELDLRDYRDQAERIGYTLLVDGSRVPLAPLMTVEGAARVVRLARS
jgi:hypothetical protein